MIDGQVILKLIHTMYSWSKYMMTTRFTIYFIKIFTMYLVFNFQHKHRIIIAYSDIRNCKSHEGFLPKT